MRATPHAGYHRVSRSLCVIFFAFCVTCNASDCPLTVRFCVSPSARALLPTRFPLSTEVAPTPAPGKTCTESVLARNIWRGLPRFFGDIDIKPMLLPLVHLVGRRTYVAWNGERPFIYGSWLLLNTTRNNCVMLSPSSVPETPNMLHVRQFAIISRTTFVLSARCYRSTAQRSYPHTYVLQRMVTLGVLCDTPIRMKKTIWTFMCTMANG